MHVTLTDRLTCPACGPGSGLVLLADQVRERRVLEGQLGCPTCRTQYAVRGGYAELRHGTDQEPQDAAEDLPQPSGEATELATRLAALLDLAGGHGIVVVHGPAAVLGLAMAELVPDIEIVTTEAALAHAPERPGVSRVGAQGLPFYDSRVRAVALTGTATAALVERAIRVVAPGGRIVIDPWDGSGGAADPEPALEADAVAAALERAGARVLARERATIVAGVEA